MDATAQTLPQYFLHQAQTQPAGKVAMRQKEFGIWREFTWNDSYEQVRAPVSYTHLTLPTSDLGEISGGAVSLKKKKRNKGEGREATSE